MKNRYVTNRKGPTTPPETTMHTPTAYQTPNGGYIDVQRGLYYCGFSAGGPSGRRAATGVARFVQPLYCVTDGASSTMVVR